MKSGGLCAPAGLHEPQRISVDLTDTTRPDPLSGDGHSPRRLNVWIWYPAARENERAALEDGL